MNAVPRRATAQVEAHVVEICRRQRDVGLEDDRLDDLVTRQVDTDELGATVGDGVHHRAAAVQDPQAVGRVDHDALHRHERFGIGVMFVVVELLARVGANLVVSHLPNREGDIVTPLRVVDEDPPPCERQ
jgi:hypothetical protein